MELLGGFPVWLRDIPGIEFQTDNMAFKEEMEKYVMMIVNLMKVERPFFHGKEVRLSYSRLRTSMGMLNNQLVRKRF
jgi:hypothetical protein